MQMNWILFLTVRITGDVRCFVLVNREWLDGVELMAVM